MHLKGFKIVALCAISIITTVSYSAAPSKNLTSKMQTMGKVKEIKPFQGGLTAWILEAKNGKNAVFYTTSDETVILHGTAWESSTKKNISDPLKISAKNLSVSKQAPSVSSVNPSLYEHPVMKAVQTLSGFKEGKGDQKNTVYIIYDPRCKYCHETFDNSRSYVKAGATIKWIPALVLNQSENGKQLAAGLLRNPSESNLNKAFNGTETEINSLKVIPNNKELKELEKNLGVLQSIFYHYEDVVVVPQDEREQRNLAKKNGQSLPPLTAGVPVAIYVNKKTGMVEARRGTSELTTLDYIFK